MTLNPDKFKYIFAIVILIVALGISGSEILAMNSSNYQINWDSINAGGSDNSTSPNYKLRDTMGQMGPGRSDSASWTTLSGYRQSGDEPEQLTFSVNAQNDSTQVSYSAFSSGSYTVTVSNGSGFATDDYIAVVENEGSAQMVAIGRIEGIAFNGNDVIRVDKWSGDQGAMSAVPDVVDDYVYKLDTHAIDFGTLSISSVSVGVAMTEIYTNAANGYSVYIAEDHNLQLGIGPNDIDDVADGTVTAGDEEYGIEVTGDNAVGVGSDRAIESIVKSIAISSAEASIERVGIIYKASIDGSSTGGAYSHVSSYYAIARF